MTLILILSSVSTLTTPGFRVAEILTLYRVRLTQKLVKSRDLSSDFTPT